MTNTSNAALKKRLNALFQNGQFIFLLASSKPTSQILPHTIQEILTQRFGKSWLEPSFYGKHKAGSEVASSGKSASQDINLEITPLVKKPRTDSHPNSSLLIRSSNLTLSPSVKTTTETRYENKMTLLTADRPPVAKSTLTKANSLACNQQFEETTIQRITLPKHVLNHYCLNVNLPIRGCRLDLLVLSPPQKNTLKDLKSLSFFELLNQTYQVAMFLDPVLKEDMRLRNNPDFLALGLAGNKGSKLGPTWHINQLLGAFVKTSQGTFFYISGSEIKQALLLHWHFEQTHPWLKSFPAVVDGPQPFLLQSFKEIQKTLQGTYSESRRLIINLFKTLLFITTHPQSKLVANCFSSLRLRSDRKLEKS